MNVLRTLIFNEQVSLTIADTTALVSEGIKKHGVTGEKAGVFARALSFLTYMSACLKEETGEISLSVKTDGKILDLCASGNAALSIRGYLDWDESKAETLGDGALTVVRDDGYNRPFVGACGVLKGQSLDKNFEEYYRISEQLPTYISTVFLQNEGGMVEYSGIIVLQPLPFADEETIEKIPSEEALEKILRETKTDGLLAVAKKYFAADEKACSFKTASYRCHCSREYLKGVLASVGEESLLQIIKEDGEIKVHCHYCNTDYKFGESDVRDLFPKK